MYTTHVEAGPLLKRISPNLGEVLLKKHPKEA